MSAKADPFFIWPKGLNYEVTTIPSCQAIVCAGQHHPAEEAASRDNLDASGGVESRHARTHRDGTGCVNPVQGFLVHEQPQLKGRHSGRTDSSRSSDRPARIFLCETCGHPLPPNAVRIGACGECLEELL
jgi:hypothetical protein